MGFILSKLWGKKSSLQVLEKLEKEIKSIEDFQINTRLTHRNLEKKLIRYSIIGYALVTISAMLYLYFYEHKIHRVQWTSIGIIAAFCFISPLLIIILKRIISFWYNWRLDDNEEKVKLLKEKKEDILNNLMDTETYKVAKEILTKFAPEKLIQATVETSGGDSTSTSSYELRRRTISPSRSQNASSRLNTTYSGFSSSFGNQSKFNSSMSEQNSGVIMRPQFRPRPQFGPRPPFSQPRIRGPPLPFPVRPKEKGWFDVVLEKIAGDSPNNKLALICKQCKAHNGMAHPEEFEYLSFRCMYCHYWHTPQKQKPSAPILELTKSNDNIETTEETQANESQAREKEDGTSYNEKAETISDDHITEPPFNNTKEDTATDIKEETAEQNEQSIADTNKAQTNLTEEPQVEAMEE